MQTIEFDSYVENGVIAIPLQYQKSIARSVRVIVFSKEETPVVPQGTGTIRRAEQLPSGTKKNLFSLGVDMSGFCFDRNEVNER